MAKFSITIRSFETYKGRKDVIHNSWFRCSNRLLEDPDFYEFSHEELLVWVYILSLASQKNAGKITLSTQHANNVCRLSESAVTSSIKKLNEIGCIDFSRAKSVRGRNADVTDACSTEITNKQTKQNKHNTPTAELDLLIDEIYNLYPRREGGSEGSKRIRILLKKDPEILPRIKAAAIRYRDHHQKLGTEAKFIKLFSTWVNQWTDWEDPAAGTSTLEAKQKSDMFSKINFEGEAS